LFQIGGEKFPNFLFRFFNFGIFFQRIWHGD
jgi:hypothetical protein